MAFTIIKASQLPSMHDSSEIGSSKEYVNSFDFYPIIWKSFDVKRNAKSFDGSPSSAFYNWSKVYTKLFDLSPIIWHAMSSEIGLVKRMAKSFKWYNVSRTSVGYEMKKDTTDTKLKTHIVHFMEMVIYILILSNHTTKSEFFIMSSQWCNIVVHKYILYE